MVYPLERKPAGLILYYSAGARSWFTKHDGLDLFWHH